MIVSLTEHNLRWKSQIADFECNCRYIESANSLSKETNIDVNRYEVADKCRLGNSAYGLRVLLLHEVHSISKNREASYIAKW